MSRTIPMQRSALFSRPRLIVAALLLAVFSTYWFWYARRPFSLWQAIPAQTALVVFQGAGLSDTTAPGFPGLPWFGQVFSDKNSMARFALTYPALQEQLQKAQVLCAYSLLPADSLRPLWVANTGHAKLEDILKALPPDIPVLRTVFKGHSVCQVQFPGAAPLAFAQLRNLLLISSLPYLVEDAIAQLDNARDPWWSERSFPRPDCAARLVFRRDVLAERWAMFAAPDLAWIWGLFDEKMDWLTVFREGELWKFQGQYKKSIGARPAPQPLTALLSAVPDDVAVLHWENGLPDWINGPSGGDFRRYVLPGLGGDYARILTAPYTANEKSAEMLVFRIRDPEKLKQGLRAFGADRGMLHQYAYQTFDIWQFLSQSLLEPAAEPGAQAFRNPSCVLLGDYVVFGAATADLELWIDHYITGQSLGNNPDFLLLHQQLPQTCSRLHLWNSKHLPAVLASVLREEYKKDVQPYAHPGKPVSFAGFGGLEDANEVSGTIAWQAPAAALPPAGDIRWKVPLEAPAETPPFLVLPGLPGAAATIFMQDSTHQLYCINPDGMVRWRKKLAQKLVSAIHGVNILGRDRQQFLFNTANAVWMLDQDGHEVAGFPLKLTSPATNGLSAVRLGGQQGQFAFYLACANGSLYGYDPFGRPLAGWNPRGGVGLVQHPLLSFSHQDKDYLVALTSDGKLHAFNRDGTPHFPVLNLSGTFRQGPEYISGARDHSPLLLCTSAGGQVSAVGLDGRVTAAVPAPTVGQQGYHMLWDSLRRRVLLRQGPKWREYVLKGGMLQLNDKVALSAGPDTVFYVEPLHAIGAFFRKKQEISLLDIHGQNLPGFPLAGTTAFQCTPPRDGDGSYLVVVGYRNAVYAYYKK